MSSLSIDDYSSTSSIDTFAPVAVYRLKYYKPQTCFDNVLYALIRPPRFVYNQKLLIPGRRYQQRFAYQVHNIPFPLSIYWAQHPRYIILYLHGNSSSRFQGYLHLKELPQGACLACFDFKGCGLRKDGKFITLGKQQSAQVDIAVQYLKTYGYPIVGWGRSMGAVSLLMSSKCQIMIADSPFASLYDLCKETSLNFVPSALCCLVHCMFPCVFCCVRSGVQKKSGMDPNELQIIKAVQNQAETKSILIMAGKQDSMINYSHAQKLYNGFKGKDKRLILFDGTHNSNRPQQVLDQCFIWIQSCLQNRGHINDKNIHPVELESKFKVLKVQRQSSKQSLLNHGTLNLNATQFQSSKQQLLISHKQPIQLKPIKVSLCRSSPKKLSKIQGDRQITQQANIQINQQQDIIREGIGKFQQNLKNKDKFTFKQISKKNEIQNSSKYQNINKGKTIKLKSITQIRQANKKEQHKKEQLSKNNSQIHNNSQLHKRQKSSNDLSKSIDLNKSMTKKDLSQSILINKDQQINKNNNVNSNVNSVASTFRNLMPKQQKIKVISTQQNMNKPINLQNKSIVNDKKSQQNKKEQSKNKLKEQSKNKLKDMNFQQFYQQTKTQNDNQNRVNQQMNSNIQTIGSTRYKREQQSQLNSQMNNNKSIKMQIKQIKQLSLNKQNQISQTRQISTPLSHPSQLTLKDVKFDQQQLQSYKNQQSKKNLLSKQDIISKQELIKKQQAIKKESPKKMGDMKIILQSSRKKQTQYSKILNDRNLTPKASINETSIQFDNKVSLQTIKELKSNLNSQNGTINIKKQQQNKTGNQTKYFSAKKMDVQFTDL